jgi:3-methyladenine DNA glycosylase AlkC
MAERMTIKQIRESAKTANILLNSGKESEFFKLTESILLSKPQFSYLYIYGYKLGLGGLENPDKYLEVLDKLFNKNMKYGFESKYFRNKAFWTQEKIKAMIFGSRISIITTALEVLGERYPKRVIPIIKRYLIEGDCWSICDGLAIALGKILMAHFDETFTVLESWVSSENRWLRRVSVVAFRELMKVQDNRMKELKVLFKVLMMDNDRLVKMGVAWMFREMSKHDKAEFMRIMHAWQKLDYDKNTIWMVKNGIKKLSNNEQKMILSWFK